MSEKIVEILTPIHDKIRLLHTNPYSIDIINSIADIITREGLKIRYMSEGETEHTVIAFTRPVTIVAVKYKDKIGLSITDRAGIVARILFTVEDDRLVIEKMVVDSIYNCLLYTSPSPRDRG